MVEMPLDVFAVIPGATEAVVTPAGGAAVSATGVQWFQEDNGNAEHATGAGPTSALSRRQVAYVRRDQVPTLPIGSTIVGGPLHNATKVWRVTAVDGSDPDYHVATVV